MFTASIKIKHLFLVFLTILSTVLFLALVVDISFRIFHEQQFVYLAKSFINGKLFFLEVPGNLGDTVLYADRLYWPLAPFPALILVPFVYVFSYFGIFFSQGYLQFMLTLGILWISYNLARKHKFSKTHSLLLSFAFCFSSIYHLVAFIPWSWYFVQAITVLLMLYAFYEFFTHRRYWLIGVLYACVFATRYTAGLGIIYFYLYILFAQKDVKNKEKAKQILVLTLPVLVSGVLLLIYNFMRFGSIWENGYMLTNNHIMSDQERYELLNYGLFQLRNIPTNFYYYFVKSLDPVLLPVISFNQNTYVLSFPYVKISYPGTSFFVVSPIFLWIFKAKLKTIDSKLLVVPIIVILVLLLCYYWPGWRQTGPRYLLDLLPFLYLVLLRSFNKHKLNLISITIIFASALLNLYLLTTIFY